MSDYFSDFRITRHGRAGQIVTSDTVYVLEIAKSMISTVFSPYGRQSELSLTDSGAGKENNLISRRKVLSWSLKIV